MVSYSFQSRLKVEVCIAYMVEKIFDFRSLHRHLRRCLLNLSVENLSRPCREEQQKHRNLLKSSAYDDVVSRQVSNATAQFRMNVALKGHRQFNTLKLACS